MEPGLLFVGLIASISATHLAVQAGKHIHARLRAHDPAQADRSGQQQMRGDWYVYFHCADLLGRDAEGVANGERPGSSIVPGQPAQVRQPSPRPRARL